MDKQNLLRAVLGVIADNKTKPQPAFDIRIDDREEYGERRIIGWVGDTDVIQVSNGSGYWKVGGSSCLPTDIAKARQYVEVMRAVLELCDGEDER